jgi:Holliday junction resolvase-like predicted endonuclease
MEYRVKIHKHEYTGEVDVLAKSPHGKWHFYEIKTSQHKWDYAHQQYMRFCNAHPYLETRGVFVSMKKVKFL